MGLLEHAQAKLAPFTMKNFPLTVTHPGKSASRGKLKLQGPSIISWKRRGRLTGDLLVRDAVVHVLQAPGAVFRAPRARCWIARIGQKLYLPLVAFVRDDLLETCGRQSVSLHPCSIVLYR